MKDIHAASDVIRKKKEYQSMVTDEIICKDSEDKMRNQI